jgi:hypothetical protein
MDADACRGDDLDAYAHGVRVNVLRDYHVVSQTLKARQCEHAASGHDQCDDGDDAQGTSDCVGTLSLRTFLFFFFFLFDGK